MAAPAMKLDRPHLDAGEQTVGGIDIEIILVPAVLFADRDMVDMVAERARVMIMEKAFLRAALRAANEADRAARGGRPTHRRDRRGVLGKGAHQIGSATGGGR